MTRLLRLLLLLGALLGLLGQQVAYAASAGAPMASVAATQMSADCMEMMQKQQLPATKPCKGMVLDCTAAMGCIVPIVLGDPPGTSVDPLPASELAFWPATSILVGTDRPPEQHPPAILD